MKTLSNEINELRKELLNHVGELSYYESHLQTLERDMEHSIKIINDLSEDNYHRLKECDKKFKLGFIWILISALELIVFMLPWICLIELSTFMTILISVLGIMTFGVSAGYTMSRIVLMDDNIKNGHFEYKRLQKTYGFSKKSNRFNTIKKNQNRIRNLEIIIQEVISKVNTSKTAVNDINDRIASVVCDKNLLDESSNIELENSKKYVKEMK